LSSAQWNEQIPKEVLQLAIAQGRVLYEIDLNFDPDDDYPKEDDIYRFCSSMAGNRTRLQLALLCVAPVWQGTCS
jgi:hypothetical protein